MKEVVFGSHNQYKVTENGDVFSRLLHGSRRTLTKEWRKLKPSFGRTDNHGGGYYHLSLRVDIDGPRKMWKLHKVVATYFHGVPPKGYQVNHIDGDRKNNHAKNLEWVTPKQNIRNAVERGSFLNAPKFTGKISEFQALSIITLINSGYSNKDIAEIYNIDRSNISKIRNKRDGMFKSIHCLVKDTP